MQHCALQKLVVIYANPSVATIVAQGKALMRVMKLDQGKSDEAGLRGPLSWSIRDSINA
jgi:hypothetical protein